MSKILESILRSILVSTLLLAPAVYAEIYKHIDERGNIIFTDKPSAAAKKIDVRTPNSLPAPTKSSTPVVEKKAKTEEIPYTIAIANPANETIIPLGPGNFGVNVTLSPSLAKGHTIQLLLDGQAHGPVQNSTQFALTGIYRGSHQIVASILDSKNKIVEQSEAIVVHVFRPRKRR